MEFDDYFKEGIYIIPNTRNEFDFPFTETMSKKVGICIDCKKKKELYTQGLCKECYKRRERAYVKKYDTLDMVLFDIAQEFDLTCDIEIGVPSIGSKIPTGETRLSRLFETQKALERAKRLSRELGVDPIVTGPSAVTVPFTIKNTETGVELRGEVVENLEKNQKQLTPVSSSNVRGVGQFGSELLVQFHPTKLAPLRTYRYMFATAQQAEEAYRSLIETGSPGRWVWQNLRGHVAGEKITASKVAPSLVPPNQGLPTIGGTTASIVPYKISNRVPVEKVKKFDEIIREMKRNAPNPTLNPMTGRKIEELMGVRKELREMNVKGWQTRPSRLPRGDFEYVGNLKELIEDYKVRGHWRYYKSGKKVWIKEYNKRDKPFWERLKELRKKKIEYKDHLSELVHGPTKNLDKKLHDIDELKRKLEIVEKQMYLPSKKNIEWMISNFKEDIQWALRQKENNKKEIEELEGKLKRKEEAGWDPEGTLKSLYEQNEGYDNIIKDRKKGIENAKRKIKKAEEFEKRLYEDNKAIEKMFEKGRYLFDITLNKKMKIAKGFISPYNYTFHDYYDQINSANNAFYDLPKTVQEACEEIRIFETAIDDPYYSSFEKCGGFYSPIEHTITIGLKDGEKRYLFTKAWIREAVAHEAAHAIHYQRLDSQERNDIIDYYRANREILVKRDEYAKKDDHEFFSEGYAKLFTGKDYWFKGMAKGTKEFFQKIMEKYGYVKDFIELIIDEIEEEINGIKFSYTLEDGTHVFGFHRIPEDISQEEAEIMVKEGKAQFENVDKYIKGKSEDFTKDDEHWVTIKGTHVFIKEGESKKEAIERFLSNKKNKKQKEKETNYNFYTKQVKHLIGYYKDLKLTYMKPEELLKKTKGYVHSDPFVKENVEKLKEKIKSGTELDAPFIQYENGKMVGFQGRHRATASKELGIEKIPVLIVSDPLKIERSEREKHKKLAEEKWKKFKKEYSKEDFTEDSPNKIIKNEEILKRMEKQRKSIERHKIESERRRQNKASVKVYKIKIEEDYHDKCDECGRPLKKALYTSHGTLGWRCYLKLIGVPSRGPKQLSLSDLPNDVFEDLAENSIKEIKNLTKEDWIEFLKDWMGDVSNIEYAKMMSPVRLVYKEKGDFNKPREVDIILDGDISLSRVLNIPHAVMGRIKKTKVMNDFWRENRIDYNKPKMIIGTTNIQSIIDELKRNKENLLSNARKFREEINKPENTNRKFFVNRYMENQATIAEINKEIEDLEKQLDFTEDLKHRYYCKICKSNHFFDSDIGKEHLSKNQKTLNIEKVESVKEIKEKPKNIFNFKKFLSKKVMNKIKNIKGIYDDFTQKGYSESEFLELGFGVDKYGNTSGKYEDELIIGTRHSVKASSESHKQLGDALEFSVHTHPDLYDQKQLTVNRHFSPDDLLNANTWNVKPVLIYREWSYGTKINKKGYSVWKEYETYYIKVGTNLPEDRGEIIQKYSKIYDEHTKKLNEWEKKWVKDGDPFYFLNMSREDDIKSSEESLSILKETIDKIKEVEKEFGIVEKKLFTYIYKRPKTKKDSIESLKKHSIELKKKILSLFNKNKKISDKNEIIYNLDKISYLLQKLLKISKNKEVKIMIKKPIKKTCPKCGRVHYTDRSCIKKKPEENNIYNIVKKKKFIGND